MSAAGERLARWGAAATIAAGLAAVYAATLNPGVDFGDAAELQYMAPLLGVCHQPGYAIEVLAGNLFTWLPLGASDAWRMNLLMTVTGVVGALALYGVVRRITGQVIPALLGALLLGFSSIY